MDDLVKRLRDISIPSRVRTLKAVYDAETDKRVGIVDPDRMEAADRIEALEAALAEKEAEVARLRDAYDQGWDFAFRQWQRTGSVPDPSCKKAPTD